MARPRSFDTDQALRRVYATFRANGFSGTSLEDLAAATDLARPSLYAAFGDKRSMYLRSLTLVAEDLAASADKLETSNLSLGTMLERWFAGSVAAYTGGEHGPGGCLAIGTAAAEAVADPDIRSALDRVLRLIDDRIARWLRTAGVTNPEAKAALIAALMHSLSLRSRAGQSADELTAMWQSALPEIVAGVKAGQ